MPTHRSRSPARDRGLVAALLAVSLAVVSTSEGLMTDTQARKKNLGGELLCYVW